MKIKVRHVVYFWLLLNTFNAGYMNVVSIISINIATGNHTGNLSNIAIALSQGKFINFVFFLSTVGSYFLGSLIAGILFYDREYGKCKRFGGVLIIYGIIFLLGIFFFKKPICRLVSFSMIAGSQNGILARFKGMTTRTTHMTGYLTDAGVSLGHALKGKKDSLLQFFFYTTNMIFFVFGGYVGSFFSEAANILWRILPGVLLVFSGLIYNFLICNMDDDEKVLD